MSTLAWMLTVTAAIWVGALTVACLLLIRQVGLLTVRLDREREAQAPVHDGLALGDPAPATLTPFTEQRGDGFVVLVLGATCMPCRDLARDLDDHPRLDDLVAVVSGSTDAAAAIAASMPARVETVVDPQAAEIVRELKVQTTPFAFEIRGGVVFGKSVLRSARHFEDVLDAAADARSAPFELALVDRRA